MERIQRILAGRGVASRRAAEQMIRDGRVSVDGQVVTELGTKADPVRSDIRVDGNLLQRQRSRYILLNKPRGYITTTKDERDRRTVLDLVQVSERVYPVGRLDRVTEGLLLLTNDGDVANRVMHPRYGLDKEYEILTLARPSATTLERVRKGVTIDGKRVVPHEFRILRETRDGILLKIVIHEGIFHVVRRIMLAVGIEVQRLRRVRIGPLSVTGIPIGTWRELRPGEEKTLRESLGIDRDDGEEDRLTRSARRGYGAPADEDLPRRPRRAVEGPPDRGQRRAAPPRRGTKTTKNGRQQPVTGKQRARNRSDTDRSRTSPSDRQSEQSDSRPVDRPGPRRGTRPERDQGSPQGPSRRGGNDQQSQDRRGRSDKRKRGGPVPPGDRDRRPGRGRQNNRRPRRGGPAQSDAL
ncbi:MAG: pseudouridine synthase [Thermomicrobiales bacterium]